MPARRCRGFGPRWVASFIFAASSVERRACSSVGTFNFSRDDAQVRCVEHHHVLRFALYADLRALLVGLLHRAVLDLAEVALVVRDVADEPCGPDAAPPLSRLGRRNTASVEVEGEGTVAEAAVPVAPPELPNEARFFFVDGVLRPNALAVLDDRDERVAVHRAAGDPPSLGACSEALVGAHRRLERRALSVRAATTTY